MPNKLINLSVKEVSGVDAAANMRKFLVIKSATEGASLKEKLLNIVKQYLPAKDGTALTFNQAYAYEVIDDQIYNMMYDASYALRDSIKSIMKDPAVTDKMVYINLSLAEFSQVVSSTIDAALTMVQSGLPVITTIKSKEENSMSIPEDVMKSLPEVVQTEILALQKTAGQVAILTKQVEDLQKSQTPAVDPVVKGMTPEAQVAFAALQKRLDDAEALAKLEREERLTKEYVAKATEFTSLGVVPEELGPVLKAIAAVSPEQYTKLETTLKSASTAIAKSPLLKEVGAGGQGESSSAWNKIEKKAEEVRKSNSSLTKEQAQAKVMKEEPELYNEYIHERRV